MNELSKQTNKYTESHVYVMVQNKNVKRQIIYCLKPNEAWEIKDVSSITLH